MTRHVVGPAREFIEREGRLVERRLAAALFDGGPADAVIDTLRGFRNANGGFGHGLEPDKRCPDSLPIDVECALEILIASRATARPLVSDACDWLTTVSASDGAVSLAFPVIEAYPRAEHWSEWTYTPGLNPTAGLAGRLHRMGVRHPWLDRATEWCWARLEAGFDEDAHALREVMTFLAHAPDRGRAESVGARVGEWLSSAGWFCADPDDPSYGLTPLDLAPDPDSWWAHLFDTATLDAHLARLLRNQQPDGGWPITWAPPGQAATMEWRGIRTLSALRVLRAYDRLA